MSPDSLENNMCGEEAGWDREDEHEGHAERIGWVGTATHAHAP